jgi:predicted alpha/beta superfamily hydrolase
MKEYRVVKMYSKTLKREKRVFIYLPKSYQTSDKFYPVLYMHDGQNLFDELTGYMNNTWNIMNVYLEHPDLPEVIIVGVESDKEKRAEELIPFPFRYRNGIEDGGKADEYLAFIIKDVKPYIDSTFRTFKSPKNTGLMGSSFGGVNSLYAATMYSEYFTRFGCLSNALMYQEFYKPLKELMKNQSYKKIKKLYMDCGTKETNEKMMNDLYVDLNKEVYDILHEKIDDDRIKFEVIKDAIHHETAWEKRLPDILNYLFNE